MFPAYAGVILYSALSNFLPFSVPCVCGGDPGTELIRLIYNACSLRMRG